MSKDPSPSNNLIDDIDVNDSSRSELIDTIEILKDEIERLNLKLNEQEKMLEQEKSSIKEEFDGSDDIGILKEMIISQRNALNEKDGELESLKERIGLLDKYKKENEELKTFKSQISKAKSKIDELTNELNLHKSNEENAKKLIIQLNEEKKEYEENEKETLQFIENLSEKNEKYKNKVKELQDKLEYVKNTAIEEVSEFDDEREEIINDYEYKIKHLDEKIENMENSFIQIKTSLEAENSKYKKRIIELQKQIQKNIKKGDQDAIQNMPNLDLDDIIDSENKIKHEIIDIKKPGKLTEREEKFAKEGDLDDEVITVEQLNLKGEILSRKNEELVPNGTITKKEPIIDSVRKCPKCGNQKKSLIREELDKSNIILAYPRMYGKKYVCGAFGCGCNWRIKNEKIEIL